MKKSQRDNYRRGSRVVVALFCLSSCETCAHNIEVVSICKQLFFFFFFWKRIQNCGFSF